MGGNLNGAKSAPKHSLQRKLLDGLRYLVKGELKLNNSDPCDGWLTEDGLWLVSKTVSDKLRAYLLSQGIEGIPSKNSILFTTLQEHRIILSTTEDKAIWNATVTSHSNGWSQPFTFLKVMPSLIWPEEKPSAFDGTGVINLSKDDSNTTETVDETPVQDIPTIASEKNTPNIIDELDVVNTPNSHPPLADSLEAVFNLLGMNDNEQTESEATPNQFIATEINQNVPHRIIDSPITVNQINQQNLILEASTKKAIPAVEFTAMEKQVMKQIDEITPAREHFVQWLKEAILMQKLIINEPQALIHTVDDTIFIVTPGIFMRYVMEFPQVQQVAKAEKTPAW